MKQILIIIAFLVNNQILLGDGIQEGFEVQNQNPFTGSAQYTWFGDTGDFELTSSSWPYGSTCDFLGNHSIKSLDVGALNSTIILDNSDYIDFNFRIRWQIYIGGNSAEITNGRGFALILFVNSNNINDIENGFVNGYRLRLGDPDGGDPDGLYFEKASGSGWYKIDELQTGDANINQGWNIVVERESTGDWDWGFSNGVIDNPVTLSESFSDNDHIQGSYSGIYWYSSSTDANDFGFDEFTIDPYTPGLWNIEAVSNSWVNATNWDDGNIPTSSENVTIPDNASFYPEISSNVTCNDLLISSNASLTINPAASLTLNGDFRVCSDSLGTGSFLSQGSLNMSGGGNIVFERYIEAYSGLEDGWHQISSPVNAFAVAGSGFEPGDNDDLFRWDEASYVWVNYKDTPFNFSNGEGYLIACETSETKEFSGNFIESDIILTDLSVSIGNGWHLLGNPFPCALAWNDGNWNLSNMGGVAKIYSESAGNYVDITAGETIPATQGFFVQALNVNNDITIPLDARTHNNMALYVNDALPQLCLKVSGGENEFFDLAKVGFHNEATTSFDPEFDARKISGQSTAPQLYTCISSEFLSTNTLPFPVEANLDLYFEAGTDGEHVLAIHRLQNFEDTQRIFLEDRYEEVTVDLTTDSSYFFEANVEDAPDRFVLHFQQINGLEESLTSEGFQAYYNNGMIYLKNVLSTSPLQVSLYDLDGRLVYSASDISTNSIPVRTILPAGIYLIKSNQSTLPAQKLYIH